MPDRRPIPASWPPRTDHGEGEQHFSNIGTIIHQLGTAAKLFSRQGYGDEQSGVEQLRHDRVDHDGDPQHYQAGRHGRPMRRRIGACNDPGVKASCCDEMEVHQVVERTRLL